MLKTIFEQLNLSENAHRVYMRLLENGRASARQLAENLNMPRPSVYDNLNILIQKGLVLEHEEENKKLFQVDDVKNVSRLLKEKISFLEKEQKEFEHILPTLSIQTSSIQPKIKFYSGTEGVKQVLSDILWYKNIETYSMWPVSEMVHVLGEEYFAKHNRDRIKRKISVRGIWPQDKTLSLKDYPMFGTGEGHLRELRFAPKGTTWKMGSWLYADKVAFISSRDETFGFIIHSKDFADWHRAQYEMVWNASKKVKPQPQYTDRFLDTI